MATRSTIAVKNSNGSVDVISSHWDIYLECNGRILAEYYATRERAAELIALGDVSSLGPSIECPPNHSFNVPVQGYTVFYGRDRNEPDCEPKHYDSLDEFVSQHRAEEFNYLFSNDRWLVSADVIGNWKALVAMLESVDA
jgi:hypothetical protein